MTKLIADSVMDAALTDLKTTSTVLHVCSSDPADRAAAIAASLADLAITTANYSAVANGDTNGRKVTFLQALNIPIDTSGTAAHICIIDATELMLKTSITSQAITAGGTITVNAFDYEIADAV